jgi:hypothetical protein
MDRRSSLCAFALLAACSANSPTSGKFSLTGVAQKGPFVLGSQVNVAELDSTLTPTGRTFTTTIADDSGAFSLPNVQLASSYVSLTANGFYFDEVAGQLSTAEIQLGAIADVTNLSTVNANLLSDLERDRVTHLIDGGATLSDAKSQAQRELLAIFGITTALAPAETLNIAGGSPDDATLLALSVILQSRRTPAELTEFLAQLSSDFAPDGTLDDSALGLKLAVGAELVDLAAVRTHLTARYQQLGVTATIGDFESVVQSFITNTKFIPAGTISYPDSDSDGPNLLSPSLTTFSSTLQPNFSVVADVPPGKSLRVHVTTTGPLYLGATSVGSQWTLTAMTSEQDFELTAEASEMGGLREASIDGSQESGTAAKTARVDIYENGATTPTFSKTITFN